MTVFRAAVFRTRRVLPGFGLSLGYTVFYLSLIVLLPFVALFLKSATLGGERFWAAVAEPRAVAAYKLSFLSALGAALVDAVFGLLVAWVLVRYRFWGREIVNALVDLPFALPTAVAGIALTALYAENGWIGKLFKPFGVKIAYTPLGIAVALVFIGLPFVVRTVQPVLEALEQEIEEAAATLGAYRWETFRRVILPALKPALLTGFALAFARGVGEYGSVVFISGNLPFKTEIAPVLIMMKAEQYNYAGAAAVGTVMLLISFVILILINLLQGRASRRTAQG